MSEHENTPMVPVSEVEDHAPSTALVATEPAKPVFVDPLPPYPGIDVKRKVTTRSGLPARILDTNVPGERSIAAYFIHESTGQPEICLYYSNGLLQSPPHEPVELDNLDLINP